MLLSIADVALSLSAPPEGTDIRKLVCERLWEITGAVVLSLTLYDEEEKSLRVHHSSSSNRAYSTLVHLAGPVIFSRRYPVSDEMYEYIMTEKDTVFQGCYEMLHGQVPRPICKILDQTLGIGLSYGFGLTYSGRLLGALSIMMPKGAPQLRQDVMNAYSSIAATALYQARMTEQIHSYQSRLRTMSTKLHQAEERERRRIACSIHDNIAQSLVHLKLRLAEVDVSMGTGQIRLQELSTQLEDVINKVYDVTYDLSPPVLYELGLKSALDWLVQGVRERDGLHATLYWQDTSLPLERELEVQAFHLAREVIRNAVKHAHADRLEVQADVTPDTLILEIIDDGIGFDGNAGSFEQAESSGGLAYSVCGNGFETWAGKVSFSLHLVREPGCLSNCPYGPSGRETDDSCPAGRGS